MALLHITDASGRQWQYHLTPQTVCTIGRAPDNCVVLNDPRASRYHAHIKFENGEYTVVNGIVMGTQVRRSANGVFINGTRRDDHLLASGDRIAIGASLLRFEHEEQEATPSIGYDDKRLGRTQVLVSANEVIRAALDAKTPSSKLPTGEELKSLRRKAEVLGLMYELSKTLSSEFNLDTIFNKATDIIFRSTPADRVVALLSEGAVEGDEADANLRPIALRVKDERREEEAKRKTIGRTVTRMVMRKKVALLSQDPALEVGSDSIIGQGVRSTICAPLMVEKSVHGALYADCLDPFSVFTRDDLELITAVAAQAAVAVENARSHERLAREEVARANYSRFLPEYVVRQMLENPESFKLGGANQTITVLFADIRGFSRLSEHAPPEEVVKLLNHYFSAMTDIIFDHGGTLDKYIGDELLALFGAPTATPDDASNAVAAAINMQREMVNLNAHLRAEGLPEISVGIGLNTGEATVGYIGSERRSEYTAIGDTVNLASRLQSNAKGGQILLSEASVKAMRRQYPVHPREAIMVKNRVQPVQLFEVDWQEQQQG